MCSTERKWYILTVVGFALCSVLSVCSVGLPGWTVSITGSEANQTVNFVGLLWTCSNATVSVQTCVPGNPFWNKGLDTTTKLLVSVGAGLQVLGVLFAVHHNCCVDPRWRQQSFVIEVFAVGGGMVLFVGSLCGVAFVIFEETKVFMGGHSLFLAIASSCLSITLGCLLHIFNRQLHPGTA